MTFTICMSIKTDDVHEFGILIKNSILSEIGGLTYNCQHDPNVLDDLIGFLE
jgi:hypothetical protein